MDELVEDPATAEALKPWYRQFCKRPCFHDEYLQAFNRPNVTLVDTDGRGVDAITPDGVVVGDREYTLDCLIFATGFEVGTDYTRRAGYDVVGSPARASRSTGRTASAPCTACTCTAFPTCSSWATPRAASRSTTPTSLRRRATTSAMCCASPSTMTSPSWRPRRRAKSEWLAQLTESARDIRAFQQQCTPGYYNNEGQPAAGGFIGGSYGKGPMPFFELLAEWRDAGDFAGLELRP